MKPDPLGLCRVLEAPPVRLEPLAEAHREGLRVACGEDRAIWTLYRTSWDAEHFDAAFAGMLADPARLALALIVDGAVAGMTAWIDPDHDDLTVEIGNTYIAPGCRGGAVNGTMKRLLFAHGFARGLKRMQLTVDTRNARSRAACRKVGATFEGVLRNHLITWTGHERDSAVFSVVARDRERLGL